MTGRNNKPDNDGPASNPARLDQYGDKMAHDDRREEAVIEVCDDADKQSGQAE